VTHLSVAPYFKVGSWPLLQILDQPDLPGTNALAYLDLLTVAFEIKYNNVDTRRRFSRPARPTSHH
jgi:hypothetical protein